VFPCNEYFVQEGKNSQANAEPSIVFPRLLKAAEEMGMI